MLIRSTWTLAAADTIALPKSYRLELIKLLHQRMGLEFDGEIPCVTYSGIVGKPLLSGDFLGFQPNEVYQLSLCGLQESASTAIADLDLTNGLEFLGVKFDVVNRDDDITSYEALYQTLVATEPQAPTRFELKFLTPTAFSQGRVHIPLPVPMSLFRSWLERWNHFAPVYLGSDELIGYLGESIVLARHRLQSQIFPVHTGRITGFTGEITLQVLSRIDPLIANVTDLLVQYSNFSGTGMKTRLGMGSTQLIKR
jgi:CRISPR-associated endoribonuclease Cas6